ncbi:MAG: hypothetical protein JST84_19210 [Acidobacteria bacterium]|nr:hypothetical protein [Acidobacteriota bacterium]
MNNKLTPYQEIPCCPQLDTDPVCDVIDFRRRLVFPTGVRGPNEQPVRVEVILHTRFTRCSGPLALGELVYTTTLLPGEKVRLATTDRRSRFSFDSETNLSYRSEQMSEEQYRLNALRAFMSDENSVDRGSDRASSRSSWDFHGDASGGLGFFSVSADTNARGSHNAESTRDYLREHRSHAEASDHQSVEATRKAHSMSIGQVSTRAHQEGQSEDHFEASAREFSNHNQCHAVTFLFYRINKIETIKFELVAIERRVLDPVAPTPVAANPIRTVGQIATVPQEVPATNKTRLEAETRGLQSEALYAQAKQRTSVGISGVAALSLNTAAVDLGTSTPLSKAVRDAALNDVDKQLIAQGLLDAKTKLVARAVLDEINYERRASLPTAGVIVKGCLDECDVCEPELKESIKLDLERKKLENQMLAKQIELLEKSQQYRCCPAGEEEDD